MGSENNATYTNAYPSAPSKPVEFNDTIQPIVPLISGARARAAIVDRNQYLVLCSLTFITDISDVSHKK